MRFAALLLSLLVVACSQTATSVKLGLLEPGVRVRQHSGQVTPRADTMTDVNLQIDIYNQSSEPITLVRLELRSTGSSDIVYAPVRRQFDVEIPPGGVETVELWTTHRVGTIMDGRASVRGTAVFDSPVGRFRTVFLEPVLAYDSSADRAD